MKTLTDNDLFPFGIHKGRPMQKVPATYLDWLIDQPWIKSWPAVEEYIERNRKVLDRELKDQGVID